MVASTPQANVKSMETRAMTYDQPSERSGSSDAPNTTMPINTNNTEKKNGVFGDIN